MTAKSSTTCGLQENIKYKKKLKTNIRSPKCVTILNKSQATKYNSQRKLVSTYLYLCILHFCYYPSCHSYLWNCLHPSLYPSGMVHPELSVVQRICYDPIFHQVLVGSCLDSSVNLEEMAVFFEVSPFHVILTSVSHLSGFDWTLIDVFLVSLPFLCPEVLCRLNFPFCYKCL